MSEKVTDETTSGEGDAHLDEEDPQVPESVVRAAEQLNRGESVSKDELMSGLDEVTDS